MIERFFRSLKEEYVWQQKFYNFDQAKEAVDKWVEVYNTEHPHQTLGYLPPQHYYARNTVRPTA